MSTAIEPAFARRDVRLGSATSWLIMGPAYHLMTHVAVRVDRALLGRL